MLLKFPENVQSFLLQTWPQVSAFSYFKFVSMISIVIMTLIWDLKDETSERRLGFRVGAALNGGQEMTGPAAAGSLNIILILIIVIIVVLILYLSTCCDPHCHCHCHPHHPHPILGKCQGNHIVGYCISYFVIIFDSWINMKLLSSFQFFESPFYHLVIVWQCPMSSLSEKIEKCWRKWTLCFLSLGLGSSFLVKHFQFNAQQVHQKNDHFIFGGAKVSVEKSGPKKVESFSD